MQESESPDFWAALLVLSRRWSYLSQTHLILLGVRPRAQGGFRPPIWSVPQGRSK